LYFRPFLVGLVDGEIAVVDGALQQEPRGKLHEAGGQAHRFGGVGQRRGTRQAVGFAPPVPVEVARGLLDQRHPLAEHFPEQIRSRQPLCKGHRLTVHTHLKLSVVTHTLHPHTLPQWNYRNGERARSVLPPWQMSSPALWTAVDKTKREPHEAAL